MIASATTAIALIISQAASDRVSAEYPSDQWELEYPAIIGGYVDGYYGCLKGGNYEIGGGIGFEAQYRSDIQRCSDEAEEMEAGANSLLERRGQAEGTSPADVAKVFDTVRSIHVARGASLDAATRNRIVASNAYAEARETGAADAAPPPCVASVNALRAARQNHMETQGASVKAVYDKPEYTRDDQRLIATYNAELMRLTGAITLELRACPEANYALYETGAEAPAEESQG